MAASFGAKVGLAEIARAAGIFHDIGKATPDFQNYIMAAARGEKVRRGDVHHAPVSAKYAYEKMKVSLPVAEMLANTVWAHHGTLHDFISPDGDAELLYKLKDQTKQLDYKLETGPDPETLKLEFSKALDRLDPNDDRAFTASMLIKYLYSCLVDADRLNAYISETGGKYELEKVDWAPLCQSLENYLLNEFGSKTDIIDSLRQNVSKQCLAASKRDKGIYKLSVPTGGGKTLSSLRFALNHANIHRMDRIIYVIPYLSITEQTAGAIRKALGKQEDDPAVLEHHSNILPDKEEFYKLHTDRWDAPIIITTQVQFLESVFSAKAGKLRKFHNMSNSVIIFDEVQSLPIKCVNLFNSALNFLKGVCGSTICLCTATQPLLENAERPLKLTENPSIADCSDLFSAMKRTEIVNALRPGGYSPDELAQFVLGKFKSSTLVILNTKKAARDLYNALKSCEIPLLHLSTNMCRAHRGNVIEDLRSRLEKKTPVICVSTQLIEAGVDISFECVIRDVAGLDSVYQAAGRCNRHGESGAQKPVYVVNVKGENLNKLLDIAKGAEVTHRLFNEGNLITDRYYRYYFFERKSEMSYNYKELGGQGGNLYDLLSNNRQGCCAYKNRGKTDKVGLCQAMRTAGEKFCVIEPGQTEVIVPYGNAEELIAKYKAQNDSAKYKVKNGFAEKLKQLHELSRFTVSLYEFQLNELRKSRAIKEGGDDGLTILRKGYYHESFGVNLEGNQDFLSS